MDPIPGGSGYKEMPFSRRELYNIMRKSASDKFKNRYNHLQAKLIEKTECPEEFIQILKHRLSRFRDGIRKKLTKCHHIHSRFLSGNKEWLDKVLLFPTSNISRSGGRPFKCFEESSERTKRKKTQQLRTEIPVQVLAYATQMSLSSAGSVEAAKILKDVTTSSPKRALRYRKAFKTRATHPVLMSEDEALSLLVNSQLSRYQYNLIREKDTQRFPSYKKVQNAKQKCYPRKDAITITEVSANINLQDLLNHTTWRLIILQSQVIERLDEDKQNQLFLVSKWGCDGSSGQSVYKQKFLSDEETDANIFISSFVPLQLYTNSSGEKVIVWQNTQPSSPRFCRPIRFQFTHETTDKTNEEISHVQSQIEKLQPTRYILNGKEITVTHKLALTMIDGKVCNAASGVTSTQKCYLCGATSKQFNNVEAMKNRPVDATKVAFGLSILHAWIRFFECILHLSYKIPIACWQARGELKNVVADRKREIQKRFKTEMGLQVDIPKPGYGNTNDGNTARRFFSDPELASRITDVDKEIINRFRIILVTLSSGHKINIEKYSIYAFDTAKLFVLKYDWYYMPTTIHKVLIHSPVVISSALLPIGQLSEEAQEARNKHFKKYREQFARKHSREKTNTDILNRLLITSDPIISSFESGRFKKSKPFPKEVVEMLMPHELQTEQHSSSFSDSEQDSDSSF